METDEKDSKDSKDEKDSNRGETARRSLANFDAPVAGEDAMAKPVATEAVVETSMRANAPRASVSASLRASLPLEASASAAAEESAPSASAAPEPSYPEPIAARLRRLEDRAAARETHWRSVLNEVQKAHAADAAGLRRQCARAVEAKNVQIRHFREKLNRLIAAMHERSLRESTRRSDDAAAATAAVRLAAR